MSMSICRDEVGHLRSTNFQEIHHCALIVTLYFPIISSNLLISRFLSAFVFSYDPIAIKLSTVSL